MGYAHLQAGRPADAVQAFEKALALDPRYTPSHRNVGEAHVKAGAPDRALAALARWLPLERDAGTRAYIRKRAAALRTGAPGEEPGAGSDR